MQYKELLFRYPSNIIVTRNAILPFFFPRPSVSYSITMFCFFYQRSEHGQNLSALSSS